MKSYTKRFTLTGNKQTGEAVESQNGNLLATVNIGNKSYPVWFPAGAQIDKAIAFNVHEKGDTFVATSDSKTSKGQAWLADPANAGKKIEDSPLKPAERDEPLFLEGQTVTRRAESVEWIGFASEEIKSEEEELSLFDKKLALLAKHKIALGSI